VVAIDAEGQVVPLACHQGTATTDGADRIARAVGEGEQGPEAAAHETEQDFVDPGTI
jgi:hypothetical protein